MRALIAILFACAGLNATACTSDRCKSENDCFAPEVCVERECRPPSTGVVEDMQTSPDLAVAADMGSTPTADLGDGRDDLGNPDMPRDIDMPATDTGGPDMPVDVDQGDGSCTVDPFTFMCDEDAYEPNNSAFGGHALSTQSFACTPGIDFRPFQDSLEGTVCPVDGTDWYRINFTECDDAAFIIELQVELLDDCDPNIVGLHTPQFDCADDLVDCRIEDGKPTLRAIVERTNVAVSRSLYVEVHNKMQQDTSFDYRLSIEVRR